MADCIFCAIVAGDIPANKVHEDTRTLAFLDIEPLSRGHALVIPKAHVAKLEDADREDATALMATVQDLLPRLCEATACQDATVAINNGPDAGQEVPHLHVHLIPRQQSDSGGPIHALFAKRPTADPDDLRELADKVLS